ncbi:MAG: FHA domain-containing protein [Planctomycetota bacterium]
MSRRFSDSSIELSSLGRVYDEDLASSAEICLYDHPALEQIKRTHTPRYRVYLTRLEPRLQFYADEALQQPVGASTDVAECMVTDDRGAACEGLLYDASGAGQLMCIGVGRFPHNLLRPFVGESLDAYYDDPDRLDPHCVCGQISRDHGLVFLDPEGRIKYRDFGTRKRGQRAGSKNGTWINGEARVNACVVDWKEGDYLGIGGRVIVARDGDLLKEHVFKLRYERL